MAYSNSNPPRLVSQSVGANGGDLWVYKDADALASVAVTDYVSDAADLGLKAGDIVHHVDTTHGLTTMLSAVAADSGGTASGALCSAIEPIGETSIALQSAGTGTFVVDGIITFNNDPDGNEYRVTTGDADISGGGTLVITPGLVVATAVGTGISIKTGVINLSTGASGRKVHASSAATRDLTASESGDLFLMDTATGQAFTLPVGVPGMSYDFLTTVDLTSNAYAVLCNTDTAGDFLVGAVSGAIEGAATDEWHFANGTTHLGFSANKTTTGGLIGSTLRVECVAANLWQVSGVQSCTATPATPFTT
jgi:hypothetical protein